MTTTDAYSLPPAGGFAFNHEENEILVRVGRGAAMGDMFRRYWIPVLPVNRPPEVEGIEIPPSSLAEKKPYLEAGGRPRRIRLLGEDLILFRTRRGEPGLIGAYCSHRRTSLYFGRVEDDGIRCCFHGWKYAPGGKCIEMPNVPAEHAFGDQIQHRGYHCREHGGVIWAYMGPGEPPGLPEFEFTMVPEDQRNFLLFHQESNYLQTLEGAIDPSHVMWLHSPYDLEDQGISAKHQPAQQRLAAKSGTRTPKAIEFQDTPGGFMYGARRPFEEGKSLWRINQFILPFCTMPPGGDFKQGRFFVPIDDENCVKWMFGWYPTREIMERTREGCRGFMEEEKYLPDTTEPYGFIRPRANKDNDYLIDWEMHTTRRMGISGVNLQDRCVSEALGPTPILDRPKEHLCAADQTIVKARRIMLDAARGFSQEGRIPPGVEDPSVYRVRAVSKPIPDDLNWVEALREEVTVPAGKA